MFETIDVAVHATGPDSCRVTVAGELDVATAADVRTALLAAVTTHQHVAVDLSGLTFCDCAGLGALLSAARAARAGGADLHLRAVPRSLARLLRLSHTGGAFTIE
ncbi:STAS domain-containing protein [Actinacidiphila soli]|uniref:STAS domain-containing protein n=1 Tax=Actinacidiphila soli TaxID=2487275 RepID=UPI0019D2A9FE|nr:STAS domain-containing protein [Actinacidiphila soli]